MTFININSKERRPVFLLFIMFFATVAATITGSAVRDSVFLIQFNRSFLPIMYILIAIVMAGVITVYKKLTSGKDQVSFILHDAKPKLVFIDHCTNALVNQMLL